MKGAVCMAGGMCGSGACVAGEVLPNFLECILVFMVIVCQFVFTSPIFFFPTQLTPLKYGVIHS